MDFTKKVNDFGLFSNVLVVNNDIVKALVLPKLQRKKQFL